MGYGGYGMGYGRDPDPDGWGGETPAQAEARLRASKTDLGRRGPDIKRRPTTDDRTDDRDREGEDSKD